MLNTELFMDSTHGLLPFSQFLAVRFRWRSRERRCSRRRSLRLSKCWRLWLHLRLVILMKAQLASDSQPMEVDGMVTEDNFP